MDTYALQKIKEIVLSSMFSHIVGHMMIRLISTYWISSHRVGHMMIRLISTNWIIHLSPNL